MDVAITMSTSIFGLYEKNNDIPVKALKTSGMEIGKDIMGTMTNILFFAYISGSIPMLILYFKNASPLLSPERRLFFALLRDSPAHLA